MKYNTVLKAICAISFMSFLILFLLGCNGEKQNFENLHTEEMIEIPKDISQDSIRKIAEGFTPVINPEDEQLTTLYKSTEPTFTILGKIIRSSSCANTPDNNLAWCKVVSELFEETGIPRDSMVNTINEIIEWYDGGNQTDLNDAAYMRQVMAHFYELEQFSNFLEKFPDQTKEYRLWSQLQASVIDKYIESMYESHHYSSLPMDISAGIVDHLNEMTGLLKTQINLLSGKDIKLRPTASSENQVFQDKEIAVFYKEWLLQRKKFSNKLDEHIKTYYDEITLAMISSLKKLSLN